MNRLCLVALTLLVIPVFAFSEQPPAIGSKFHKKWKVGRDPSLCVTQPAQMDPCVGQFFDGIKYQIAYSEKTHRVSYVFTNDENFVTLDGLRVGDAIPVTRDTVHALPGFEVWAPTTRDGWWPIVGYDLAQIKLSDASTLDLSGKEESAKTGKAVILGFSKIRP